MIVYRKATVASLRLTFSLPLLVRQPDVKADLKPWEQLAEMYPGLVEPLRESWNDPFSQRTIYMITPSKSRAEQAADLTRLAQTLSLVNGDTRLSHLQRLVVSRFPICTGSSWKTKSNRLDAFADCFSPFIYPSST